MNQDPVTVTLTATDSQGSVSTITNAIDFSQISCVNFIVQDEENEAVNVLLADSVDRFGRFSWNTEGGDSPVALVDSFLVDKMELPEGTEHVCLSSAPASADCEHGYCRNIPKESESCTANFIYTSEVSDSPQPKYDNMPSIALSYRNEEGLFQSKFWEQKEENYFLVKGSDTYDRNENGQLTRKLNVEFSLKLINIDTGKLIELSGQGYLGVALPE